MKLETREPTRGIRCPACKVEISFYAYSGMGDLCPHFYCDTCSNLYHNYQHSTVLREKGESWEVLTELVADLPRCPCGGQFAAGANPKCPACGVELAHQSDPVQRLSDPYAIQLKEAVLYYEDGT